MSGYCPECGGHDQCTCPSEPEVGPTNDGIYCRICDDIHEPGESCTPEGNRDRRNRAEERENCPSCGSDADRKPGEHWILLDGGKKICTNPWHNPRSMEREQWRTP